VVGTVKATDANGDKMTYKASVTSATKGNPGPAATLALLAKAFT
jgi:hypothetical protein